MKYKYFRMAALLLPVFFILLYAFVITRHDGTESNGEVIGSKVIVIDAGHGGVDGGSSVNIDFLEKDINLDMALRLKKLLDQSGAQVVLTRDADVSLEDASDLNGSRYQRDLDARKDIINRSNADIFVSIHTNCYTKDPSFRGAIVFYSNANTRSKALCDSLARSIDEEVYTGFLHKAALKTEVLPARYYILRNTNIPGTLIEVGFLSNREENRLLHQEDYKNAMVHAICNGIIGYFEIEKDIHKPVKDHMMEIFGHLLEQI